MISIERTRELLGETGKDYTDEELDDIRFQMYELAGIAFDKWMADKKKELAAGNANTNNEKEESKA